MTRSKVRQHLFIEGLDTGLPIEVMNTHLFALRETDDEFTRRVDVDRDNGRLVPGEEPGRLSVDVRVPDTDERVVAS